MAIYLTQHILLQIRTPSLRKETCTSYVDEQIWHISLTNTAGGEELVSPQSPYLDASSQMKKKSVLSLLPWHRDKQFPSTTVGIHANGDQTYLKNKGCSVLNSNTICWGLSLFFSRIIFCVNVFISSVNWKIKQKQIELFFIFSLWLKEETKLKLDILRIYDKTFLLWIPSNLAANFGWFLWVDLMFVDVVKYVKFIIYSLFFKFIGLVLL